MNIFRRIGYWLGAICFPIVGSHVVLLVAHTDVLGAIITGLAFINLTLDSLLKAVGFRQEFVKEA